MTMHDALAQDATAASCAPAVASAVGVWRERGYPGATETSKQLLAWWFDTDHLADNLPFSFYPAQREAIESLIYVYEVLKRRNQRELLEAFMPNPEVRLLRHGDFARYGIKMATGSGKTLVMALSVVWSYLNAINEPEGGDYAKNFLIVAPNVIVFERLAGDFNGGEVFRRYPMVPPEFAGQWRDVRFVMRGDATDAASDGVVYVTNIQQLYETRQTRRGRGRGGPPAPIAALLGPAASDTVQDGDDFADWIVRRGGLCMVINDEAHHTHDEDSEWNQTIRRLRDDLPAGRFMAQLDFSATPRFNDGTLFPWVIYDYPLRAAIDDGIVKRPIAGEVRGAGESASDDASVRYGAYITAAVRRWDEYREQLAPLNKKPVLFVMMESARDADNVGAYLQRTYSSNFGDGKLQVIHIDRAGEVSRKDLENARQVVRNIDSPDSSINAVVSVMMLREGWDVRNVTVVLGLRPYTSAANILPEQAIGRGLRLMFPGGTGYDEQVDVIGTEKFMEFVENLERDEGVSTPVQDLDANPVVIVTIMPDPEKADMDIAIPSISPSYERTTDTRALIEGLDVANVSVDHLPFSPDPLEDKTFEYLGVDALTDAIVVERTYRLHTPNTCGEVISHYASRISAELALPGHFDVIYGKLREFFSRRAFGQPIDLDDNSMAAALANPVVGYFTVQGFNGAIRPLLRQEIRPVITDPAIRLLDTQPFPWSRPTYDATKSVFNLVAADNQFEAEFARILEAAPDVVRFAKLPMALGFKIQYIANTGNLRNYYPDFVAVDADGRHYLIETKGQEDTNVANKDRAASHWCRNATALTGVSWQYLKVAQIELGNFEGRTLADIAGAFGRR